MGEKRKLRPITIVLLIVVSIIVIVGVAVVITVLKYEKKKEQERIISDYQSAYNRLATDILNSAADVEKNGGQIILVWQNSIFKKQDSATDSYTRENGEFVADFNDAIAKLYQDGDFQSAQGKINTDMWNIKNNMKDLVNPPEGFEDAYSALKDLYDSYLEFANIVLSPQGSLNDYTDTFNNADRDILKKYNTVELYIK